MSRKKKKKKPRLPAERQPGLATTGDEPRASVAATVAWMLTTLCTAVAELLALGAFLLSLNAPPTAETPDPLLVLSHTMLWIALITGLVTLGLTAVVYRVRQTPPPGAITAFSVIIGLIPPVILIVANFR